MCVLTSFDTFTDQSHYWFFLICRREKWLCQIIVSVGRWSFVIVVGSRHGDDQCLELDRRTSLMPQYSPWNSTRFQYWGTGSLPNRHDSNQSTPKIEICRSSVCQRDARSPPSATVQAVDLSRAYSSLARARYLFSLIIMATYFTFHILDAQMMPPIVFE